MPPPNAPLYTVQYICMYVYIVASAGGVLVCCICWYLWYINFLSSTIYAIPRWKKQNLKLTEGYISVRGRLDLDYTKLV